jgi:hypothetical protein
MAFKFLGELPRSKTGTPLSHQLPQLNIKLTGAVVSVGSGITLGKRRLVEEYIPSAEELENLKGDFEDVIPSKFTWTSGCPD